MLSDNTALCKATDSRVKPLQQVFEFVCSIEQHYQKQDNTENAAEERRKRLAPIDVERGNRLRKKVNSCKTFLQRESSPATPYLHL